MERNNEYVNKNLRILEALIEVLPRDSYIRLHEILGNCKDYGEVKQKIMDFFEFSPEQAEAVCEMRLKTFSSESVEAIKKEYLELKK